MSAADRRPRVLVLEDEFLIGLDIMLTLQRVGAFPVGPTHSLDDAAKAMEREDIDAALLNIRLGRDELSYPVADILARRGIPFAFVTGCSRDEIPDRFETAPLFTKPVIDREIREWVTALPPPKEREAKRTHFRRPPIRR